MFCQYTQVAVRHAHVKIIREINQWTNKLPRVSTFSLYKFVFMCMFFICLLVYISSVLISLIELLFNSALVCLFSVRVCVQVVSVLVCTHACVCQCACMYAQLRVCVCVIINDTWSIQVGQSMLPRILFLVPMHLNCCETAQNIIF